MKLLIPLSYLNEACFLSNNTDEKKFKMVLKLAQDQLKYTLGGEFYEEIETQYGPISDTFSTANATLYEDYIKDYLAWQTYIFYLQFAQADDTPSGIREFNDENSSVLSDVKMASREGNVAKQANYYKNAMVNFLKLERSKDSNAYPLWVPQCGDTFSWGISSIGGVSHESFKINKAINTNE